LPPNRDLLLALLQKTRDSTASLESLREMVRITDEAFTASLLQLKGQGILDITDDMISASLDQRLKLAVTAVKSGADFERVSKWLGWLEFEEMVAYTFEENGYRVKRRYRFQTEGRRWEIDVLAMKKPLIVCAECKHWAKGLGNMTARRIVEGHMEKVRVMSEHASELKRVKLSGWGKTTFLPMTLSLIPARNKIYRKIPVVSVFELPRFLGEFQGQMEWLTSYTVEIQHPE
jgi:Holliday junction resolvase-like predicted endonuclease